MNNPPVSGGPRLGKLRGLAKQEDENGQHTKRCCGGSSQQKGGIKMVPLILMFVMFGPVLLTGLIYVIDIVGKSELGVKIGMVDDPRTRLTKFYKKYNPTKMRDVDTLMKKYKGRYADMFKKLEDKYVRISPTRKKQQEEEEEYLREQERYAEEERAAREAF